MRTKFKTSPKSQKESKSVKGFSIIGGKVNTVQDYYRLKYPKLYGLVSTKKEKKDNLKYLNNKNFRNSQNYAIGDLMKNELNKKNPNFSFLYTIISISSIFMIISKLIDNYFLFNISLFIITFYTIILFLTIFNNKIYDIKNNIKYKKLGKKYKSKELFLRLKIKNKINKNDFIIIKKIKEKVS